MRILVTGGAGYIGGTVASILSRAGYSVVIYDNLCHAERSMVPADAEFVQGDIADRPRLEAVLSSGIDGVLHFAALIEAGESMAKPELYFRNNTAATLTLFEAMISTGVRRLVFSSTAAVYGEPDSTPIREDAPLRPTNAYGESKLLVEKMLAWMYRVHGFACASLRYFNVAGALEGRGEAHEPESHLIPLVLDVALGRREKIKIYGEDYPTPDGTCIRDYIHVEDLAHAHRLALEALAEPKQLVYNIGNGSGFSVREVIESARRATRHPIPVEVVPRRPGDPAVLIASSEKIGRELGWKPQHTALDSIMESAWRWQQIRYNKAAR
ncbi:MAG TPA: UDP-glucose 4-epimerase GalE [Acidobacteriaceae bacterium]|nr:UDP-glucose 4-epimerase GalE [Acidobacteriaceae bacterium]